VQRLNGETHHEVSALQTSKQSVTCSQCWEYTHRTAATGKQRKRPTYHYHCGDSVPRNVVPLFT